MNFNYYGYFILQENQIAQSAFQFYFSLNCQRSVIIFPVLCFTYY